MNIKTYCCDLITLTRVLNAHGKKGKQQNKPMTDPFSNRGSALRM